MWVWHDGDLREMTPEEIEALAAETARAALVEKSRPLSEAEVLALLIPGIINTAQVDDNTALRMCSYYPEWAENIAYAVGYKVQHGGRLWRCIQAHTSLTGWEPENVASLWAEINETHDGTEDDPIPYSGNMALVAGLYYVQDWVVYRCIRDTINPVYNALADLAGLYVEML